MTQSPGTATSKVISSYPELNQVVIENSRTEDECILFPAKATDDELQTKWLLAKEGSYLHPKDAQ